MCERLLLRWLLLITVAFAQPAFPALLRGPYLQKGTSTSLVVRWRTDLPTDSVVRCGANQNNLAMVFSNPTVTTNHEVAVTGLGAVTRYFYSIGTAVATLTNGADMFFWTPPVVGTVKPTRIWVLGDSGSGGDGARAVRDAYLSFNGSRYTDLWLMLGDNAYYSGLDTEYQAGVFDMYPKTLKQSVLWPTIGNHDTAFSTAPPPSLPYFQIFTLPKNGEAGGVPSGTENYYSFDYANIHFVCLDSMASSRSQDGPMLRWLHDDLSNTSQEWIIAFWHHPPYSHGSHDSDWESELIEMRENALPILEEFGVDLVLCGHSHSYERTFLLNGHYGSSTTLDADTMVLNGGNGREDMDGAYVKPAGGLGANQGTVYAVAGSSAHLGGVELGPPMFIALNNLGSMILDVDGYRLDAKFLRETGVIADYFTINKGLPTNVRPTMKIVQEDRTAELWWPSSLQEFVVERTAGFEGSVKWATITNAPERIGRQRRLIVPTTNGHRFYRLRSP
jgi:acid phosphatase type 7